MSKYISFHQQSKDPRRKTVVVEIRSNSSGNVLGLIAWRQYLIPSAWKRLSKR